MNPDPMSMQPPWARSDWRSHQVLQRTDCHRLLRFRRIGALCRAQEMRVLQCIYCPSLLSTTAQRCCVQEVSERYGALSVGEG